MMRKVLKDRVIQVCLILLVVVLGVKVYSSLFMESVNWVTISYRGGTPFTMIVGDQVTVHGEQMIDEETYVVNTIERPWVIFERERDGKRYNISLHQQSFYLDHYLFELVDIGYSEERP